MVINRNDVITKGKKNWDSNFTALGLSVTYSRYENNFNIICENIEFEDINLKDTSGWTPLICAVRESNRNCTLETVELILKYKPNINTKTIFGNTALHICCKFINSSSNIETMKLLLEHNADVNLKNNNGTTALIELVENKNLKAIKLLLQYGAKINIKNFKNKSAIDICIERYKFNSEIIQTLLTVDKNIDYKFFNYLDFNFIYKN
jgi:ankyrin repeat protein